LSGVILRVLLVRKISPMRRGWKRHLGQAVGGYLTGVRKTSPMRRGLKLFPQTLRRRSDMAVRKTSPMRRGLKRYDAEGLKRGTLRDLRGTQRFVCPKDFPDEKRIETLGLD